MKYKKDRYYKRIFEETNLVLIFKVICIDTDIKWICCKPLYSGCKYFHGIFFINYSKDNYDKWAYEITKEQAIEESMAKLL
jgi:hypothetical protein